FLQHSDFFYLFFPSAEFGPTERSHRRRRLDWRKRSRRDLRARLYFWRWCSSRRLAQRFQEFSNAVRVGFRLGSVDGLGVFRSGLAGRTRRLWRTLLFLWFPWGFRSRAVRS